MHLISDLIFIKRSSLWIWSKIRLFFSFFAFPRACDIEVITQVLRSSQPQEKTDNAMKQARGLNVRLIEDLHISKMSDGFSGSLGITRSLES